MAMLLADFFRGKNVFLTGHTGFKGAWMSHLLCNWGARVTGFSLPPHTSPNLFSILNLAGRMESRFGDIRDYALLETEIRRVRPEIIFHLAAQALVRESYDDPLTTFSSNVMGTVHVLEAARKIGSAKAVVVVTTDKVYENKEDMRRYREEDMLGCTEPYSASKAAAEIATQGYVRSFFHPDQFGKSHATLIGVVRAGNVIGGGDWGKDRLIPDLCRAVYEGNGTLAIRYPKAIRPWQHVLEPLHGYLLLAQNLYEGNKDAVGAWNFGPEESDCLPVEELLSRAFSILGRGSYRVAQGQEKYEAGVLMLDSAKAKSALGWLPRFSLDTAIRTTLDWYKAYYDRTGSPAGLMDAQINTFFQS